MSSAPRAPRAPVILDRALEDPGLVEMLVKRGSPYWSVQRYLKNLTEMAALSDAARGRHGEAPSSNAPMFVAPWFRGDWAYDRPLLDGVEPILENPRFADAARTMFPGSEVRPQIVYVNLNPPMPQVDPGHTDVPAFRGIDRTQHPVWLLVTMLRSGLFDRWYVPTVTAVAWYYDGPGGGFRYWPEGPHASPVDRPCVTNTAVVGDNDVMFHCVHQVGPASERVRMTKGLTLDSKLVWNCSRGASATLGRRNGAFDIEDDGKVLASFDYAQVRVSVSWKAQVFPDARARAIYEDHSDDLSLDEVERIFTADLRARGDDVERPDDLRTDTRFMNALNAAYRLSPTVFEARAEPGSKS